MKPEEMTALNEWLAVNVMGWALKAGFWSDAIWEPDIWLPENIKKLDWQPTRDIAQAIECAKALPARDYNVGIFNGKPYAEIIHIGEVDAEVIVTAEKAVWIDTESLALSIATARAAGWEG